MPNHSDRELASLLSEDIAALRTERARLLDLLRDCHSIIDAIMAKVISLDPMFRPTETIYWPIMERLSATLRKNKLL